MSNARPPILLVLLPLLLFSFAGATQYDPLGIAGRWAIDFYKGNISELQGRHLCNFNPTCSQFSKQAIDHYGFLPGVLMTADRLERCNPYAPTYLGIYYHGVADARMNDPIAEHYPWGGLTSDKGHMAGEKGQGTSDKGEDTLVTGHWSLSSVTGHSPLSEDLGFADYLFNEHDYRRAISEYKRSIFAGSSRWFQTYARYMIAESQLQLGDFAAAEAGFREAMTIEDFEFGYLGMARSLLAEKRYDAARHYAGLISDSALMLPALLVKARADDRQYDFRSGAQVWGRGASGERRATKTMETDSLLAPLATWNGHDISWRSRALSTAMSAVIPGLGQTYSGRAWDGLYSFMVVGTAGLVTWYYGTHHEAQDESYVKFGLCAALSVVFYAGNILGANIAARDYNRLQNQQYLQRIEALMDQVERPPDYRSRFGIPPRQP